MSGPPYDAERGGAIWNRRMSPDDPKDGPYVASWMGGNVLIEMYEDFKAQVAEAKARGEQVPSA